MYIYVKLMFIYAKLLEGNKFDEEICVELHVQYHPKMNFTIEVSLQIFSRFKAH